MTNDIFRSKYHHPLNAVVGDQLPADNMYAYQWGYASAVEILLDSISKGYIETDQEKVISATPDILVYPILYCARHHLELFIKMACERVASLRRLPYLPKVHAHHGLKDLYKNLDDLCKKTDPRLTQQILPIGRYVHSFDEIDKKGETFRYPKDLDGNLSLATAGSLDLHRFSKEWAVLDNHLRDTLHVIDDLLDEYGSELYTKNLSLAKIKELSNQLPNYKDWSIERTTLEELKSQFGVSSKEFSEALNIIKSTPSLSVLIGKELVLTEVDESFIKSIMENRKIGIRFSCEQESSWKAILAILEIGGGLYKPEMYRFLMAAKEDVPDKAHLVRKIVANPKKFFKGLELLGQPTLIEMFHNHGIFAQSDN